MGAPSGAHHGTKAERFQKWGTPGLNRQKIIEEDSMGRICAEILSI